ncbi:CHAT domain-containing protein [[Phormidium] sp. ETS-05]|uniref:CHAT domain-containing protein n=1 Tax=[Phormidium] sp. ETS-05 TaxID=222819 RepID=UPI0018EECE69|nr:CHAT domain-containing protein [[Phormidium] sp. ETS-05]
MQYARILHNLASQSRAMGWFTDAEELYRKAMEIWEELLEENHPEYATSLHNLGVLYCAMGRFTDAEDFYRKAMEIRKAQLGENHPHYAASLSSLAILMAAMNRPQEALSLMQEAAKIQNRIIGEILSISSDRQRLKYLRQKYSQLEIFLSLVNQYLPHDSAAKQAALDLVLRRKGLATEAGILLRTLIVSGRYPHLLPQLDELRQLHHQIAYVTWQVPTSPEGLGEYRQRLADLNRKKDELEQFLSRQIPEMNLQQQLDNANRQAIAATLPKASTLVELVQFRVGNFLGVEANGDAKWLPARYLAFILPAGESERVEMVDLGDAGEIDELCRQFRLLAAKKPSENPGEKRVAAVFDNDESSETPTWIYPEMGKQLYAKLIQLLKPYLPPQQVVYLSPDGELATVPLGILSADGTVELMQEYQLRYLNVGRDILRFNVQIPVEYSPPLVIANPDYNLRLEAAEETSAKSADLSQGESSVDFGSLSRELGRGDGEVFKPLPGSKIEGERIAQLLGVPVYTETQAVKSLLSQSRSPKIVHIATHGYFLEVEKNNSNQAGFDFASSGMMSRLKFANLVNPLTCSGLAFAGANTALKAGKIPSYAEDGLLTAQGAIVLDLTGTELVVLSACDTALGNKAIGEGVIGLRLSFIVAGAETLVMSLWKVPDVPTAILMERLYHNLLQKQLERTAALEDAQDYLRTLTVGEMRKTWLTEAAIEPVRLVSEKSALSLTALSKEADNFQPFSLPFYWAAFVCIGDHRKMRN